MKSINISKLKQQWERFRKSANVRNFGVFLIFVAIAALFWFIMALNDNVQDSLDLKFNISEVPDSVTFITDPPQTIHVSIRDKGTSLVRNGALHNPSLSVNFNDYAQNGEFKLSKNDLMSVIKATFGNSATVLSVSIDSIHCQYTTLKGRRVPVDVSGDFEASPGNVIKRDLRVSPGSVLVYSKDATQLDTLTRVFTQRIVRRGLSNNTTIDAPLRSINGAKIVPATVSLNIQVEPLVSQESVVAINADNVPEGTGIVLFPSRIAVSYYTPMSRYGDSSPGIKVAVDYSDIGKFASRKLPVRITFIPDNVTNVRVLTDSVEYSVVK